MKWRQVILGLVVLLFVSGPAVAEDGDDCSGFCMGVSESSAGSVGSAGAVLPSYLLQTARVGAAGGHACPVAPASPAGRAASAFAAVRLRAPSLDITPPRFGVTQHATEVTLTATGAVVDSEPFGASTLTVRAVPEAGWVGFGEGPPASGARLSHVWQADGCYLVRIAVRWRGEWSLDGTGWRVIGTKSTRTEIEYPVAQVVGVLARPGAEAAAPEASAAEQCDTGRDRHATSWE